MSKEEHGALFLFDALWMLFWRTWYVTVHKQPFPSNVTKITISLKKVTVSRATFC